MRRERSRQRQWLNFTGSVINFLYLMPKPGSPFSKVWLSLCVQLCPINRELSFSMSSFLYFIYLLFIRSSFYVYQYHKTLSCPIFTVCMIWKYSTLSFSMLLSYPNLLGFQENGFFPWRNTPSAPRIVIFNIWQIWRLDSKFSVMHWNRWNRWCGCEIK